MEAMSRLVSECGLEDIVPVSVARDVTGLLPDSGERGGGARGKVVGRVRGAQLRCACEVGRGNGVRVDRAFPDRHSPSGQGTWSRTA